MLFSLKLYVGKSHTIKNHLLSFGIEKLEQTGAKHIVNGEEIKARKKTSNKWFETQDQIGYYKEFAKPKIVYPNMTSAFPFTYDETGSFSNDKSFVITEKEKSQNLSKGTENVIANETACHPERSASVVEGSLLKALLAIFNSKLCKLWIWHKCPELGDDRREISKAYFENLRIPLNNTELLQQLATLADEIIRLKKELVNSNKTQVPEPAEGPTEATQKQITDLETQVNTLVYQLYGISDAEEIDAVEKR